MDLDQLEADLKRLVAERGRLDGERRALVDVLASEPSDGVLRRVRELDADVAKAEERVEALRAEIEQVDAEALDPVALAAALRSFDPVWDALFPAERARVLALVLTEVVFDAQAGEVGLAFRTGAPAALTAELEGA